MVDKLQLLILLFTITTGFGDHDECEAVDLVEERYEKYLDPIWGGVCYDNDTCVSYLSQCECLDLPYETVYGVCQPTMLSMMLAGFLAGCLVYTVGLSSFIGFVWLVDIVFTGVSVSAYLLFSIIMGFLDILVYWYQQVYKVFAGLIKNIKETHVD